jgi:hypothetical protein
MAARSGLMARSIQGISSKGRLTDSGYLFIKMEILSRAILKITRLMVRAPIPTRPAKSTLAGLLMI